MFSQLLRRQLLPIAFILMACNLVSATPSAPDPHAIGPEDYPPDVNPLTGLSVADPRVLERAPIVVKISNSPPLVRPQAGLSAADLVYEHYTEAGITRFSAIFYSQDPERVGSIRSARLIDYELVPMYQALLAFAGASIGVEKYIYGSEAVIAALCARRADVEQCRREADIIGPPGPRPPSEFATRAYKGVLYGPPYYRRDETIPVPHNLFVNLRALWERAQTDGVSQRPSLRGMAFHPAPPPNPDGSGQRAEIRYLTTLVQWDYDPDSGRYLRTADGQPHTDANNGERLSSANVAIIYAGHYLTDIVESGSIAEGNAQWSAQITIWPQGEAILLRDGQRYHGRWLRPTRPELLTFATKTGHILYLKPGNTWFQVVRLPEQMDPEHEWVRVE